MSANDINDKGTLYNLLSSKRNALYKRNNNNQRKTQIYYHITQRDIQQVKFKWENLLMKTATAWKEKGGEKGEYEVPSGSG